MTTYLVGLALGAGGWLALMVFLHFVFMGAENRRIARSANITRRINRLALRRA